MFALSLALGAFFVACVRRGFKIQGANAIRPYLISRPWEICKLIIDSTKIPRNNTKPIVQA